MLTETPDNSMSFYTCGYCDTSVQVPAPLLDGDGAPVLNPDTGQPVMVNDEPAAMAELGRHMAEAHPDA